jgi:tRNA-2-methylthio-N6-dimethylallyladenosine synthase
MARFSITTFGCQMNKHDSERLEDVLRRAGHAEAEEARAEVVVLNTCSVREKAEQKLRSEVGRLIARKRDEPELTIVVAGCMAQQEGEKLVRKMPGIDLVIGPDNIPELPELLAEVLTGGLPRVSTVFDVDEPRFLTAPTAARGPTAFVTTMKGCNERCSFCIVPYTRGPERYRPSAEIIGEIAALSAMGVKEVTLLGQTVNSYRDPAGALAPAPEADPADPDESEFASLIWAIAAQVPDLLRLRYTSPHPRHLTRSLIRAHRELSLLPRHVHLPVQSGSNRMLKRMIRRYTRETYLERVAALRAALPDATVSTDVIVGFSGETEADFAQTLSLVEEADHMGVFGFKYSPRPFTPALKMGDDVPEAEKAERLARLFSVSESLLSRHLAELVGTTQRVLVEGRSKARPENLTGRTDRNEIVHLEAAGALALDGTVVEVTIVEAFKHSLLGTIDEATRKTAPLRPLGRRALPVVAGPRPSVEPTGA